MKFGINGKAIYFASSVIGILNDHRQYSGDEAGGILLGQVSETAIYVCRASTPTALDKRSLFGFKRTRKAAQMLIEYEFRNSEGRITYLGEWHSHPEMHATPSGQDVLMIKQQYEENTIFVDCLLLVVLGRESDYVGTFNGKSLAGSNHTHWMDRYLS